MPISFNNKSGQFISNPQSNTPATTIAAGPNITISQTDTNQFSISASNQADISASYLVVGNTSSLPNERIITAGNGITFVDGGANSTFTINNTLFQESGSGNLRTTSSLAIGTTTFSTGSQGAPDAFVFISGTVGNDGSANNKKLVIGGDLVCSGNIVMCSNNTVFSQNNNGNQKRTVFTHTPSGLDFGSISAITRILSVTALTHFSTGEIRFVANSVQAAAFKSQTSLQLGASDATTTPGNFHLRFANGAGTNISPALSIISSSFGTGNSFVSGGLQIIVPRSSSIGGSTTHTPVQGLQINCPTGSLNTSMGVLWCDEGGNLIFSRVLVGAADSGGAGFRTLRIANN